MPTEADTCRRFVVPKLQAAGWDNEPYSIAEQRTITDGRIVFLDVPLTHLPSTVFLFALLDKAFKGAL